MRFFTNVQTIEELKKEFRKLAFIHHPDKGGNAEDMKQLNNEYDEMFKKLQKTSTNKKDHNAVPDEFRNIIMNIIHLDEIDIEIIGTWVWVSGNTKKWKYELKTAGFRWASKKQMWYWHSPEEKTCGRGKKTIDEIRETYGTTKVMRGSYTPSLA